MKCILTLLLFFFGTGLFSQHEAEVGFISRSPYLRAQVALGDFLIDSEVSQFNNRVFEEVFGNPFGLRFGRGLLLADSLLGSYVFFSAVLGIDILNGAKIVPYGYEPETEYVSPSVKVGFRSRVRRAVLRGSFLYWSEAPIEDRLFFRTRAGYDLSRRFQIGLFHNSQLAPLGVEVGYFPPSQRWKSNNLDQNDRVGFFVGFVIETDDSSRYGGLSFGVSIGPAR